MTKKELNKLVQKDCKLRGEDWIKLTKKQKKTMRKTRKRRKPKEVKTPWTPLSKLATLSYMLDAVSDMEAYNRVKVNK